MKNIIIIALLCATTALTAQNVIKDTIYTTQQNSVFYEITRADFETGGYIESSKLIGDTTALVNYYQRNWFNQARTYDDAAQLLRDAEREMRRWIQVDIATNAAYGRSPLTELQQQFDSTFLVDTWQLEAGGEVIPVTFSRTAAGRLRVSIKGTVSLIDFFGKALQIRNYPASGTFSTLYEVNANLWCDANRRVFLRRVEVAKRG